MERVRRFIVRVNLLVTTTHLRGRRPVEFTFPDRVSPTVNVSFAVVGIGRG